MLEAGKYYVGDLCYILRDKNGFDWKDLHRSTNGLGLELEPWCETRYLTYKDAKFFNSATFQGDGEFKDQYSRTYGVDGVAIGCFPMSKLPKDVDTLGGHVINFEDEFDCEECDEMSGVIRIGHIVINTGSKR
tara:strand:+ start:8148 stop:8546 length:399 start_codon:yes stop_codon:yes gene_type:complete